jgi:fumarate reductase flavoprotein subunit
MVTGEVTETGADLVIVGAGVAGLTAARRAQQLGVRAVILERFGEGPGFGNGRLSGGWFHAAMMDPAIRRPDELYDAVIERTDGCSRPDVVRAWADNVARALEFLRSEGGDFGVLDPDEESMHHVLMPPRAAVIGRPWENRGPDNLLTAMWKAFVEAGGEYRPGHRAVRLETGGAAVAGVWAETDAGTVLTSGRSVLLCDGGFQGNAELVARYITPHYKLRGSPLDTGDALLMGVAVGAMCVNMEWFYGYPLCADSMRDDRLWPNPGPNALVAAGIVVDGRGRRFVDETSGGEAVANAMARSETPDACWAVFDDAIWEGEGRLGDVPVNPILADVGGTILDAADVGELAGMMDVPAAELARSMESPDRPPRAGGPPVQAGARLMAIPLVAGITFTMGGLLVNRFGQVLDGDEEPIPGLYAAGGTMGGLQGGPRIGVAGGWSEASTFGLLAAEHIAGARRP